MKTAQNPNKTAKIKPFAPVVVLVITHLPEMTGEYHHGRLEVIKRSLRTLTDSINMKPEEYDLLIWDNGSCHELREWLDAWVCKRVYTCNIGKTNALKSVMRMLPPGTVLAYGDDDIEYFPNWLEPQIKILQTFPNVGTVTGYPSRLESRWGVESVTGWAAGMVIREERNTDTVLTKEQPQPGMTVSYMTKAYDLKIGRFIPDEWERDYCESHGRNWDTHIINTKNDLDTRITYKGVQAYALGHHCQFVCYPERVEPLIEWTDDAMAAEIPFDKAVDAAGLLRLATVERYTRHIGNVLEKAERIDK